MASAAYRDTGRLMRRYRRMAWLALAAMLLVLVGPLISQSQRLLMQAPSDMPMAHQAQAQATSGVDRPEHAHHGEKMHHSNAMAVCGYCELFAHTPGLVPAPAVLATPPAPAHPRPLATRPQPCPEPSYPRFAPRAPPQTLMS
ncbi:DUF2946 domain-containing protein [Onishia niordana]|uniref:DUF2946 domain-containing protein n=1 Tax=Onishia niordana TaxID=2508711 RepID=UPI00144652B3|nr:DUF2946 domain-containing protein [Halomonas niordiana]